MKTSTKIENSLHTPQLEIKQLGSQKTSTENLPFACELNSKMIQIIVPTYARVSVQNQWRWVDIHNGQHWGAIGVQSPQNKLDFSFPTETSLRISANGKTWLVRLHPVAQTGRRFSIGSTIKSTSYFGLSLIGHISLLLLLWYGVTQKFDLGGFNSETEKAQKEKPKPQASAAAEGGGEPVSRPFEGITFTEYSKKLEAAKREANPLGFLAQSLNKMKVKSGAGKGKGSGVQSATGVIGSGLGTGTGTSLTDAISNQKFNVQATGSTAGGKQVTEKQKLALREKFRELQDDFKRIYSKLLSQDPSLSVTVAFQTRVQGNGYLELSDFKARGTYQPSTIPQLKGAMADVLRSVYVGPELSGLTLRAENVFVR